MADLSYFVDEQGPYAVPAEAAGAELEAGAQPATPEQVAAFRAEDARIKFYGTPGQTALAGAEAAGRALTFGLSDVLARAAGVSQEALRSREEVNPVASGVGTAAGILAPLLVPGVGEVAAAKTGLSGMASATAPALISRAGGAAAKVAGEALPEATSVLGRALRGSAVEAARGATEGAAYGVGEVVHEAALGDPDLTWQKAAQVVGASALLGGGLGGALGGAAGGARGVASKLLPANASEASAIGKKLGAWLGEVKGTRAIKAAGGIQSDITRVEKQIGRERLNDIGQEMFDLGLVGPLSTPAKTLERAQALKEKAGGEIGAILRQADLELSPEAAPKIAEVVGRARAEVLRPMAENPLEQEAASRLARVLDGYELKFSGGMTASDLHGMRREIDRAVYGMRGTMDPYATPLRDALHDLRSIVSREIDSAIDVAGLDLAAWKSAKRRYEVASRAEEFADKGLHRAQGNNLVSLTEVMGGLSGGVAAGPLAGLATGAGVAFARRQASGILGAAAGAARDLLTGRPRVGAAAVEGAIGGAAPAEVAPGVVRAARPGEARIVTPQRPRGEVARYEVVEADDLIASHREQSFAPNPRYPAGVQERPYHTAVPEQKKVTKIGDNLNPALVLADSPTAVDGPPIVTSGAKRLVLGGNGRTMGIKRAFASSPAAREAYRRELAARAPAFGVDAERVAKMRAPVLVRVVEGLSDTSPKADLIAGVRRFNEGLTQELSPKARAVAEAATMDPRTVQTIGGVFADAGDQSLRDLMRSRPADFVTILQRDGIINDTNRAAMVAGDQLTDFGKDRVEGMFLGRVVGTGDRMEATAPGVLQKVERITPHVLRVEGVNPALGELATVQGAIDLVNRAARNNSTVEQLVGQGTLAGMVDRAAPDAATVALAKLLETESSATLSARFAKWAREAAVDPKQTLMFEKPPTAAGARRTLFAGLGVSDDALRARAAPAAAASTQEAAPATVAPPAPAPETVEAVQAIQKAAEASDRRVDSLASTLVRSGVKVANIARTEVVAGVAAHHAHDRERQMSDFNRRRTQILQWANNPTLLIDHLTAVAEDLHEHAPSVAQAAQIDVATKVAYLASIVPHPFVAGPLAKPIDPPLSAVQRFRRIEEVVFDPPVLLKLAGAGTLTPDLVRAVAESGQAKLLDDLRARTFEQLVTHGIPVDRSARLQLSFLFGQDLDGSIGQFTRNQAVLQGPSRAPSQQPLQPSPAGNPAAGAIDSAGRSQTDLQRSAARS